MMKRIYVKIYAIIASILILGTIFWFVTGIISDSKQGTMDAKNTFEYFAKSAIKLAEKKTINNSSYNSQLIKIAENIGIRAFRISQINNKILVSWPDATTSSNRNIELAEKESGLFTKKFTGKIKLKISQDKTESFIIDGVLTTLGSNAIFIRSRSAFFIILTVSIITFLIILLQTLYNSEQKVYTNFSDKKEIGNEPNNTNIPLPSENVINTYNLVDDTKNNEVQNSTDETETEKKNYKQYDTDIMDLKPVDPIEESRIFQDLKKTEYTEKKEYTLEDLDDLTITKIYPYEAKKTDSTVIIESMPKPINDQPIIEQENNTYSETTGVYLEESLHNTLESELREAAASEQDVALIIIKLKDLSLESLVAKKIAQILIKFIKFKERIFEYEDSGFATILYDADIDIAMEQTEHIFKNIQEVLKEYVISEPIAIGITTRSSRLIDANRMIEEARAALSRAIRNPDTPIIAFKINPDKYRQFISET